MIKNKSDLTFYLKADAVRNGMDCSLLKYLFFLFCGIEGAHVYRYLKFLRYTEYHYNSKGLLHKLFYLYYNVRLHRLGFRYHIQIPINKVGYGLRIMHLSGGGGVLLNVESIGNYCGFNAGVLIGNNGNDAKPRIGDYVAFGPGSSAFGDITIGSNVFVAPGAVVRTNIPPNCIVGGIPAKIIKQK